LVGFRGGVVCGVQRGCCLWGLVGGVVGECGGGSEGALLVGFRGGVVCGFFLECI